jgi:hypothetical protein
LNENLPKSISGQVKDLLSAGAETVGWYGFDLFAAMPYSTFLIARDAIRYSSKTLSLVNEARSWPSQPASSITMIPDRSQSHREIQDFAFDSDDEPLSHDANREIVEAFFEAKRRLEDIYYSPDITIRPTAILWLYQDVCDYMYVPGDQIIVKEVMDESTETYRYIEADPEIVEGLTHLIRHVVEASGNNDGLIPST